MFTIYKLSNKLFPNSPELNETIQQIKNNSISVVDVSAADNDKKTRLPVWQIHNILLALEGNTSVTTLDLSNQRISATDFKFINGSQIKKLILRNTGLKDAKAKKLFKLLEKNNTIEYLDIRDCDIGWLSADAFSEMLTVNSSLKELAFGKYSPSPMGQNGYTKKNIAKIIESLKANKSIERLSFNTSILRGDFISGLGAVIEVKTDLIELRLLNLHNTDWQGGMENFSAGLAKNKTLQSLHIQVTGGNSNIRPVFNCAKLSPALTVNEGLIEFTIEGNINNINTFGNAVNDNKQLAHLRLNQPLLPEAFKNNCALVTFYCAGRFTGGEGYSNAVSDNPRSKLCRIKADSYDTPYTERLINIWPEHKSRPAKEFLKAVTEDNILLIIERLIGNPYSEYQVNRAGVSLHYKDEEGNTALHHAVQNNYTGTVSLLRRLGASPFIRNNQGLSPIELAYQSANQSMVDLLQKPVEHIALESLMQERKDSQLEELNQSLVSSDYLQQADINQNYIAMPFNLFQSQQETSTCEETYNEVNSNNILGPQF